MPLAFPSHQGLILPIIADRWRLDTIALSVGAALPDIVELLVWVTPFGGDLGQGIGHSLIGVILFVPVGLLFTMLTRRLTPRRVLARLDRYGPQSTRNVCGAIVVGALSHVLFDFVTHANFVLLVPFYEDDNFFPSWWTRTWASVPLVIYRKPYPIAPHTIAWSFASVLGIVLFVRMTSRNRRQG